MNPRICYYGMPALVMGVGCGLLLWPSPWAPGGLTWPIELGGLVAVTAGAVWMIHRAYVHWRWYRGDAQVCEHCSGLVDLFSQRCVMCGRKE